MSEEPERLPGFLGRGWAFPPAFGPGGSEVVTVEGEDDIVQSLRILLSTRQGERPMREEFGCSLDQFLFEGLDQALINRIRGLIEDAVLYYEPRIEPLEIEVSADPSGEGRLSIRLEYRVLETNSRFNMVFPFYLNEARGHGV